MSGCQVAQLGVNNTSGLTLIKAKDMLVLRVLYQLVKKSFWMSRCHMK